MICDLKLAAACGFALLLGLAGCGSSDGLNEISGTVTYNGQPVDRGSLTLLPADDKGPTAATVIAGGKYTLKVAPGPKRVRIEGYKVLGQRRYRPEDPQSPMVDVQEQTLPARYNTKSELTREITSSVRTYDFTLEK